MDGPVIFIRLGSKKEGVAKKVLRVKNLDRCSSQKASLTVKLNSNFSIKLCDIEYHFYAAAKWKKLTEHRALSSKCHEKETLRKPV
jgi:hypothetical protein